MIVKQTVFITPFETERTLHIYLPDDYEDTDERYPVMYMFDGQNLFVDEDASFGKSWKMKNTLDRWRKKFIVVGLECSQVGNERLFEFCPYTSSQEPWNGAPTKGAELMEWIVNELKPVIDRDFRTLPFRETTAVGGSSMGGLMALYAVVCHNDIFSKAACLSSATFMCMNKLFWEIRGRSISPDTRVFLSWGSQEFPSRKSFVADTRRNLQLNHELNVKGAQTYPYLHMDGIHSENSWAQEVPLFLEYLWE